MFFVSQQQPETECSKSHLLGLVDVADVESPQPPIKLRMDDSACTGFSWSFYLDQLDSLFLLALSCKTSQNIIDLELHRPLGLH